MKTVKQIEKKLWGFSERKEIFLFCLENSKGTKLFVSNFGATAQALIIADKDGKAVDVLLGYDNLNSYEQDDYYIGSVVGRHAGRIATGKVSIANKTYHLAVKEQGYHLHGGVKGFNKRIFDYQLDDRNPNSIVFSYLSKDMEEGFPGNLQVNITYRFDDNDQWHIEYNCTTDQTTLLNITQHAYFNLAGHTSGNISDHILQINSNAFLPVNNLQVPTGIITSVEKTVFDFTIPKRIGDDINKDDLQIILSKGYDHSWALKTEDSPELKKAATVTEPTSGRKLEVYTTQPAIHFYSGNFLNSHVIGKEKTIYNAWSGFCLETQHFPDSPNNPQFPSIVLNAGEKFYSKTIYAFSIE